MADYIEADFTVDQPSPVEPEPVLEQIEAMANEHAGKHSDADINPHITFHVREIEFE